MFSKLKPSVKKKWVAALRSGKYKQTKGQLRRYRGGFCCLGVLCDVLKTNKDEWKKKNETSLEFIYHKKYSHTTQIPVPLREKIGLDIFDQATLADMNDGGVKFNKIADYIEEKL